MKQDLVFLAFATMTINWLLTTLHFIRTTVIDLNQVISQ